MGTSMNQHELAMSLNMAMEAMAHQFDDRNDDLPIDTTVKFQFATLNDQTVTVVEKTC